MYSSTPWVKQAELHLPLLPACLLGFIPTEKLCLVRNRQNSGQELALDMAFLGSVQIHCCATARGRKQQLRNLDIERFIIYSLWYQAHLYDSVTPDCNIFILCILKPAYINECIALTKIKCEFPIKYPGGKIFVVKILTNAFWLSCFLEYLSYMTWV